MLGRTPSAVTKLQGLRWAQTGTANRVQSRSTQGKSQYPPRLRIVAGCGIKEESKATLPCSLPAGMHPFARIAAGSGAACYCTKQSVRKTQETNQAVSARVAGAQGKK
jgi:hypothetical protein